MPSCNTYRLTWVSLTLGVGISSRLLQQSATGRDWNSGAPMRPIKMGAQLDVTTEPPSSVTTQSTTVTDPTNKIMFNSLAEPEETYSLFFIQPIHPSPLESR